MGVIDHCEPNERTWRLQLRRKLRAREVTTLRRALYWIDGLLVDEKERLVAGEALTLCVEDRVIGVLQLATPRIPLETELLTPEIPPCVHTQTIDDSQPAHVRHFIAHIHARQTARRAPEEACHAER